MTRDYDAGPTDPRDVEAWERDEAAAAVAHLEASTGGHTCETCQEVIDHASYHRGFSTPGCALCVVEARP